MEAPGVLCYHYLLFLPAFMPLLSRVFPFIHYHCFTAADPPALSKVSPRTLETALSEGRGGVGALGSKWINGWHGIPDYPKNQNFARVVSFYLLFDYSRRVLWRLRRVLSLYPFPHTFLHFLCSFYTRVFAFYFIKKFLPVLVFRTRDSELRHFCHEMYCFPASCTSPLYKRK